MNEVESAIWDVLSLLPTKRNSIVIRENGFEFKVLPVQGAWVDVLGALNLIESLTGKLYRFKALEFEPDGSLFVRVEVVGGRRG